MVFVVFFILLAVAERDGGSPQGSHLKQKLMTQWSPCIDNNDNQMTFVCPIKKFARTDR